MKSKPPPAPPATSPPAASPDHASPASSASPTRVSSPSAPPASSAGAATGDGPDRYRDRDRKLLHFLRVYRIGIYQVLTLLFFGIGKSCGHVMRRLSDGGLIEIHKRGFPNGITWICLTAKGARAASLRQKPVITGSATDDSLQTLLFCTLSQDGKRRHLLEHDEVKEVYSKNVFASNVHVVLTEEFGEPVLLRCYHARSGSVKSVVNALHSLVDALSAKPGMERAFRAGHVGVATLCPTSQARDAVQKEVAGSLSKYRIVIEWAPDSGHLSGYLKKQKNRSK